MKTIKNITITTKFTAGYGGLEVSESVYKGLCKIEEQGGSICDNEGTHCQDEDVSAAFEWLGSTAKIGDAYNWEYEIELDEADEGVECKLPHQYGCPYQSCMGTTMCQFHEVIKHGAPEWEAACGKKTTINN